MDNLKGKIFDSSAAGAKFFSELVKDFEFYYYENWPTTKKAKKGQKTVWDADFQKKGQGPSKKAKNRFFGLKKSHMATVIHSLAKAAKMKLDRNPL